MADKDTVKRFGLGYVDDPLPGHQQYRGMLSIPYLRESPTGEWSVVSMRFRRLTGTGSRYLTMAGDRPRLFNTRALAIYEDFMCITEGELDTVVATACGLPSVSAPGAKTWQKHFREPFLGYETVFILADGDTAGEEFAEFVAGQLPNAKIIPMDKDEDVNSFVVKHGKKALLERIGI